MFKPPVTYDPYVAFKTNDNTKIFVTYYDLKGEPWLASKTSLLEVENNYINAEFRGTNLAQNPIGIRCAIDNHEVSEHTFKNVQRLLYIDFVTNGKRADNVYFDEWYNTFIKMKDVGDNMMMTFEKDTVPKIEFELGDSREDYWHKVYGHSFDKLRRALETINCRKDNNMISNIPMITNIPKIVDYKYIAENGVTIIKWSDGTSTTVICEPETADQYTGFVTAIAKKAFGNGGKMLSEWDRLVVKPVEDAKKAEEKAKIEAEKKAAEDKLNAETQAKKAAKKAERKKKREIEKRAKEIADKYYKNDVEREAKRIANEKYGVPKSHLD